MALKKFPKKITIISDNDEEPPSADKFSEDISLRESAFMASNTPENDISNQLKNNFLIEQVEIPFDHPEVAGSLKTDLVFNLCEGVGYEFACKVIDSLENAHIPYVGANSLNYHIGSDKALLKDVLNRYHLPTPQGQFFGTPNEKINPKLNFPLIIKPELEHGSVGIAQESVVRDENELRRQLKRVMDIYHEGAVAEEYIDGLELQITLVGNQDSLITLPIKEILFVNGANKKWHVVTFAAKWEVDSEEYKSTPTICPTPNISEAEKQALEKLGREIFIKTNCQDYTRIDIRYDQRNKITYILDVNPNPDLAADAAVAKAAQAYGWDYHKLIMEIISSAWKRSHQTKITKRAKQTLSSLGNHYQQIRQLS